MSQQYENLGESALETTFNFPVDTDFALTKLHIKFKDDQGKITEVETEIEERQKAQEKYDDAIAQGDKMPVMATHKTTASRKMLRVQMGNFPPRSKA